MLDSTQEGPMGIGPYVAIVWRRKWLVVLTTVVAAVVAVLGSRLIPPSYTAMTTVRVAQVSSDAVTYTALSYNERIMNTLARLLTSREAMEAVAARFTPRLDAGELAQGVTVEVVPETELLEIAVEHADPHVAMAVANTLAAMMTERDHDVFYGPGGAVLDALRAELDLLGATLADDRTALVNLTRRAEAEETAEPALEVAIQELRWRIRYQEETYESLLGRLDRASLGQQLLATSISVIDPAVLPERSGRPSRMMSAALGMMLGLVGGVGLAFVRDRLDPRIRSARQIAELGDLDVLMAIPPFRLPRRDRKRLARLDHTNREAWGACRALGRMVFTRAQVRQERSVLIASADAGVGRSTIALNLAVSLAESGLSIIVVDGDVRRPGLHQAFDIPHSPGLTNVVLGECSLHDALAETTVQGLRVLTSGSIGPAFSQAMSAPRLGPVLRELEAMADLVLLDSPSILESADALEWAAVAHRLLFIVMEDQSLLNQVAEAIRRLGHVHCPTIGMVVNRAHRMVPLPPENPPFEAPTFEPRAHALQSAALTMAPRDTITWVGDWNA